MDRQQTLQSLLEELKTEKIYSIRKKLEDFLQQDSDRYTEDLQKAISDKLDGALFHHQTFADFLSDYQKNNPSDPAGYSDLRARIYGE